MKIIVAKLLVLNDDVEFTKKALIETCNSNSINLLETENRDPTSDELMLANDLGIDTDTFEDEDKPEE